MKSQNDFKPDRSVLGSLTILGRQLSSSAGILFNREFGVSVVDWAILAQKSNLSAKQISQLTVFDKALISRRLKYLNQSGFVSTKLDKNKRNRSQSSLTAKGMRLYLKILPIAQEREQEFLSGFSAGEKNILKKFLLKLHENIPALLK